MMNEAMAGAGGARGGNGRENIYKSIRLSFPLQFIIHHSSFIVSPYHFPIAVIQPALLIA
jgi:hypothetical protein